MNIMTKRGCLDNVITYQHICDTSADIANIPSDQITLGSTCVVLVGETGGLQVFMADSQKQWQPITILSGEGEGGIPNIFNITDPQNGDTLIYDSDTEKWINMVSEVSAADSASAAAASASAAAASADSAADSADRAMSGTPEGYAEVVSSVSRLPTEQTAQELLARQSEEILLAKIITTGLTRKLSVLDNLESGFSALPTQVTALQILDEMADSNRLLEIIKDGVKSVLENSETPDPYPDYYQTELDQSIADYRKNQEAIGHGGTSFVFITDTHWGVNQKHSPKLIRYLIENSNLRNVICGGDILDSGSKASEMAKGYDFMAKFAFAPGGLKCVIGNHDWNRNGHDSAPSYWMSLNETYATFCPKSEMEMQDVQCIEPDTGMYEISYYIDIPATNIRLLFVSLPFGSAYTVTLNWAQQMITDNPGKDFILFSHFLYKNANGERAGGANALIYRIQDYSNVKAWIFGHIHADRVYYTNTGIPLVATDTDSSRLSSANKYTYTQGTITEHAFDIVTVDTTGRNVECVRVGRGRDRRINGGVNSISAGGTTALTTILTGTVAWESSDTSVATVNSGTVTGVAAGSAIITAIDEGKEEYWYVIVS